MPPRCRGALTSATACAAIRRSSTTSFVIRASPLLVRFRRRCSRVPGSRSSCSCRLPRVAPRHRLRQAGALRLPPGVLGPAVSSARAGRAARLPALRRRARFGELR
jgi:hypothetical protein